MSDVLKETDEMEVSRYPIFLNDSTIILLSIFESQSNFEDLWTMEFSDPINNSKAAAEQLMSRISEHCSVDFLWTLREEIKRQIEKHNKQFGSNFPFDRSEK